MNPEWHRAVARSVHIPTKAGICLDLVKARTGNTMPLTLGVCLGHQSIGQAYGGKVVRAPETDAWQNVDRSAHDRTARRIRGICRRRLRGDALPFADASNRPSHARSDLAVIGGGPTENGLIMGAGCIVSHPVHGVQFHPGKSIASEHGHQILLRNFIALDASLEFRRVGSDRSVDLRGDEWRTSGDLHRQGSPTARRLDPGYRRPAKPLTSSCPARRHRRRPAPFLMALRLRGETVDEITGAASDRCATR